MDPFELLVEAHRPTMKAVPRSTLSLYVRPRATIDIDAFVDMASKDDLDKILGTEFEVVKIGRFHSKLRQADVEIDILYAAVILGTELKAPSPEALLWLYLLSDEPRHFGDAIALLRSLPALDIGRLRRELERHQPGLLAKLEHILTTARQPVPSYEESRARRS